MAFLQVLMFLIIINVKAQQYSYPDFKQLGIKLPIKLHQHVSAVYDNKLFIFGGRNGSIFDAEAFSTRYWMLDLSQINIALNTTSKNDINMTQLNTGIQWQQLTVENPSYGISQDGFIRCQHQCTTLIDNYLYIISPYGKTDTASQDVYRLDLSQIPPVYASNTDLTFKVSTGVSLTEPCITSTSDNQLIYMIGGNLAGAPLTADDRFYQYNISTQTWTQLTVMPIGRQSFACAVSYDNAQVYTFGGRTASNDAGGSTTIAKYTVSTATWTTNNIGIYPELVYDLKCVSNNYDETIICPGGLEQITHDDVIIYGTPEGRIINSNVKLDLVTNSYGLAMYQFINDGIDQASILFVTGGIKGSAPYASNVYDTIQYMVIYNVPTSSPTPSPTSYPTNSPSNAPTQPPSMSPSMIPTQPPSMIPTFAPSNPETTVIETRQGTAPEKQTEIYGTDPNNSSQRDIFVAMMFTSIISYIAMYI